MIKSRPISVLHICASSSIASWVRQAKNCTYMSVVEFHFVDFSRTTDFETFERLSHKRFLNKSCTDTSKVVRKLPERHTVIAWVIAMEQAKSYTYMVFFLFAETVALSIIISHHGGR